MTLCVVEDDIVKRDELIGNGRVSLARARHQGHDRQQVLLYSKRGKQSGTVYVTLTFTRNSAVAYGAPYGAPPPSYAGYYAPPMAPAPYGAYPAGPPPPAYYQPYSAPPPQAYQQSFVQPYSQPGYPYSQPGYAPQQPFPHGQHPVPYPGAPAYRSAPAKA